MDDQSERNNNRPNATTIDAQIRTIERAAPTEIETAVGRAAETPGIFLVFSYRDPIDLLLGIVALAMALIWTFGFMGIAGIPFSQLLIAIPPLLLAVEIDFGIHAINRYREERVQGREIDETMGIATDQLLVAFFIVTGTTVFGFGSNIISNLQPTRQFGIVAAVGITFTFLIFEIFLPAAKVSADRLRDRYGLPEFGMSPLGEEGSVVGRALSVDVTAARKAPYAVLALALYVTVVGGFYATDIRSSSRTRTFCPRRTIPSTSRHCPNRSPPASTRSPRPRTTWRRTSPPERRIPPPSTWRARCARTTL